MARGRWLKPEFFTDSKLGRVTREARLLYAGLWTLADDRGHVSIEAGFIRSRLFPYDDDLALADLQRWMVELARESRIEPYMVNGEWYARMPTFARHQTIKKPSQWRNPDPPKQWNRDEERAAYMKGVSARVG